jgi:hypothetical protein
MPLWVERSGTSNPGTTSRLSQRQFFDNPVDCIRQPKRDEISRDSSRQITLEGSRRASGQFRNARSGWSPGHKAAGWLARTGTRFWWDDR